MFQRLVLLRRFLSKKPPKPGKPKKSFQETAYDLAGFNKYGLMRDDLLDETDHDVQEALTRLDPDEYDCRVFRILRATQLSLRHEYLPKSEWTKFEDDYFYLTSIIKELHQEQSERKAWESKF
ncbi:unnamed protein product [Brassicogethes aeneus]|uniref:Cytochrome b-c1 complex subunit 7 n=1 Tax=Brassicogethes aeneus TaxID=1431903 RepID=A0A9P0AQ90_BRAAE|nr:unnamed protein product [Brassicogethes aeneus]